MDMLLKLLFKASVVSSIVVSVSFDAAARGLPEVRLAISLALKNVAAPWPRLAVRVLSGVNSEVSSVFISLPVTVLVGRSVRLFGESGLAADAAALGAELFESWASVRAKYGSMYLVFKVL